MFPKFQPSCCTEPESRLRMSKGREMGEGDNRTAEAGRGKGRAQGLALPGGVRKAKLPIRPRRHRPEAQRGQTWPKQTMHQPPMPGEHPGSSGREGLRQLLEVAVPPDCLQ